MSSVKFTKNGDAINAVQNGNRYSIAALCEAGVSQAAALAPVDTGELKASINSNVSETSGIVSAGVAYAPYVEFGTGKYAGNNKTWTYYDESKGQFFTTSGQKPQPFMQPALDIIASKAGLTVVKEQNSAMGREL